MGRSKCDIFNHLQAHLERRTYDSLHALENELWRSFVFRSCPLFSLFCCSRSLLDALTVELKVQRTGQIARQKFSLSLTHFNGTPLSERDHCGGLCLAGAHLRIMLFIKAGCSLCSVCDSKSVDLAEEPSDTLGVSSRDLWSGRGAAVCTKESHCTLRSPEWRLATCQRPTHTHTHTRGGGDGGCSFLSFRPNEHA